MNDVIFSIFTSFYFFFVLFVLKTPSVLGGKPKEELVLKSRDIGDSQSEQCLSSDHL